MTNQSPQHEPVEMPRVCEHDTLEVVSVCCGATAFYGFCARCHEHTGWVKWCEVCEQEIEAEEPVP